MDIIIPVEINETTLFSSTIAEPDISRGEVEWRKRGNVYITDHEVYRFAYNKESRQFYVMEQVGGEVRVYDESFVYAQISHSVAAQVANPTGIAVDDKTGFIYILDKSYVVYRFNSDFSYSGFSFLLPNSNGRVPLSLSTDGYQLIASFEPHVGGETVKFVTFDGQSVYPFGVDLGDDKIITGMSPSNRGMYMLSRSASSAAPKILDVDITLDTDAILSSVEASVYPYPENGLVAFGDVFYSGGAGARANQMLSDASPAYGSPAGSIAINTSTHKKYQSLTVNQTNPAIGASLDIPNWIELSPTNKFAAFDEFSSTQSFGENQTVEIKAGAVIGGLACFNISGASTINIKMTDPIEGVVYNKDIEIIDYSAIVDWFAYFFNPVTGISEFVVFDLPPYLAATLKLSFTGSSVGVGAIVTGAVTKLGTTLHGTSIREIDLNTYADDGFGNTTVTKRPSAKLVDFKISLDKSEFPRARSIMQSLSGKGAVFASDSRIVDDFAMVYGTRRDYELTATEPTINEVPIQIRGFT